MATSPHSPNTPFRRLRGQHSPAEFAALVRRAAKEIGETVSCDARYIGRVESGEIRCPNYAYERVFLHMFPGRTLADLGFSPRETVRGRLAQREQAAPFSAFAQRPHPTGSPAPSRSKESDVLRRAFMAGGSATVAAATLSLTLLGAERAPLPSRAGESEAAAVEDAVRQIRLLDDRHGADALYRRAAEPLRTAYALLDAGATRQSTEDRLHAGAGELAISVGWLAHDSGRFDDARSHYAEALATARVSGDAGLEAHAFSNMAFLARDCGRPRESVRAAQAGRRAARSLGSPRLLSLLALREAGGWAGLSDRKACEEALTRAHTEFSRGEAGADPEWMSFFGEAELESLESRCWAALGEHARAARHARRAADLQDPHFARNVALYTAELADNLAHAGAPDEAAWAGGRVLELLEEVQSTRIQSMLAATARTLVPHQRSPRVGSFLAKHASA
ncbi:tetratricopeptide repeat protein [Streptomyces sp. NBC_01264]|uniref:tetratricopeptide repeat protein n=1 Tax=Streptomyces sp. NBC_01264 TaxID=2903804 RepID=UPI002254B869|nr:tetratricopeptide repeat protein [Streptomyces sp. NBC_01264]MCX4778589.1 tetratricopeptide repeat protein [Streptomyces sp. NBC_01264]